MSFLWEFIPKNIKTPFKKDHGRYALFVGRLIYYKGVLELVSALKKTSIKLVMIGEGPLESMIKEEGKDLIKNGQLVLLPFQKKKHCKPSLVIVTFSHYLQPMPPKPLALFSWKP